MKTQEKVKRNNRISWLDMAKGYGTLLVIFAHLGAGSIRTWIYTFHMPLFFLLSGYVFNENYDFSNFIKKKCKSIVVPYFCLGIPMVLFEFLKYVYSGRFGVENSIALIKAFLMQRRLWTLWFIACLFCLNILFFCIVKFCKSQWIVGFISVLLPFVGLIYYGMGKGALPWNMDVCLMAIPFFFAGYCYKKHAVQVDAFLTKRWRSLVLFVVLALVNLVCAYFSLDETGVGLEMFDSKYGNPIFTYVAAFAGVACLVIFSKWFVIKPIRYIGENSMLYYAWHQTIMMPVVAKALAVVGVDALNANGWIGNFIYKLIWMAGIVLIITMCNWMIKKLGWKFMLGK